MRDLHHKVIFITGATRGIGRAIAEVLAVAGARALLVARSAHELQVVAGSIREGAVAIPCDVTDAGAVAHMVTVAMEAAGANATTERPLAWISLEANRVLHLHELVVRHWPGGGEPHLLARAHPHGATIEWLV